MASDVVFSVVQYKAWFMINSEKNPIIDMYSRWVINKVRRICWRFGKMGSYLRDAEEKQTSDDENVSKPIEEFLGIAHDLEDIVDIFVLGRTRRRRSVFIRCITFFKGPRAYHNLLDGMMQIEERFSAWKLKVEAPLPLALVNDNDDDTNNPDSEAPTSSSNSSKQQHNDQVQVHLLNELPSHLRPCLLYLGMFPRETDIPVRRLFHLWLAEDFLVKSFSADDRGLDAPEVSEDLAVQYLEDLEKRGMVRVSRSVSDESPKRCRMTGKFYDTILPEAERVGFFHIHKNITSSSSTDHDRDHQSQTPPPKFAVRRVAEYANIKDYPADSELYVRHLRSYASFNFQKKDMQALQIGNFVSKIIGKRGYSLLTVLDLERVYKPALPEELGYLYHLRYLGLRWTFVDALPSSVRNLIHLQTLDLKHTFIRSLPVSFWNLHFLRHLYLNDIPAPKIFMQFKFLHSIQTLSGIWVDRDSWWKLKAGFINYDTTLKKLGLTGHLNTSPLGWIIAKLTSLQSLKLRSTDDDEMGRPSSLHLVSLVRLKSLTKVYLLGELYHLGKDQLEFPPSLRDLTLSCSRLNDDPMLMLGRLPHLTVLRLLANSYSGSKMVSQQSEFGSLRILQLWVLEDLEEWVVEQGAMQNLQKLEIRRCHKLKSVPETLINSTTLEELTLTNMPEEFVAQTQILSLKTNTWKLIIR